MSELTKFNATLKKYLTQAQILEKTHPSKSIPIYTKVCEYVIAFAKSKACPTHIKGKLILQAETLVQKIKHLQEIASNRGTSPVNSTPNIKNQENIPFLPQSPLSNDLENKEITEADFALLPNVPKEVDESNNPNNPPVNGINKPSDSKNNETNQNTIKFNPMESNSPENISALAKLEEELKKMPSNLKEIKPSSFGINPEGKDDLITLDITSVDVGAQTTINPDQFIPKDTSNEPVQFHIKGFKSENSIPNTDNSPKALINGKNVGLICKACGGTIKSDEKLCPHCGASLD